MGVSSVVDRITDAIIDPVVFLLFALGFLYFLWGITVFIWKADNEEARTTGIKHMLWGVIGMFIMVAALGITKIIEKTFGL